jgi:hypothetical protein
MEQPDRSKSAVQKHWEGLALIDTGSQATMIRPDVASMLGLGLVGVDDVQHPSLEAPVTCPTTYADVTIIGRGDSAWTFDVTPIVAPGLKATPFVLGMDAFEGGELRIDFVVRAWSFRVPPEGTFPITP